MLRCAMTVLLISAALGGPAVAQDPPVLLSDTLEMRVVPNVGASWVNVPIANALTTPVVSCTYNLPSISDPPATVRLRNVGPTGFELRVQQFETSNSVTASDVHCVVAETGAHTLADGRAFEAGTVSSSGVNGRAVGWGNAAQVRIDTLMGTSFATPVVLGSVMSFNDTRASVFWTNNGSNRGAPPTGSAIWIGKHIGQINGTRNTETLSYIVVEAGTGTANGASYAASLGADSVAGTANNPPYTYSFSGDADVGVAQQAAEDGGDGGWAVLYGNEPLPNGLIQLAIEEETVARDMSRTHTQEQVFTLIADRGTQEESFSTAKTVITHPDSATEYNLPGDDVLYTITLQNVGTGPTNGNPLFMFDTLPAEVSFVNDDANGSATPGTDPVAVIIGSDSGLSVSAADIGYSTSATPPADFGDCGDTPSGLVDTTIRHVCVRLNGTARPSGSYPDNEVSVLIRARIK